VEAIVEASPNDESDWIEWKNKLSLREKKTMFQIGRHILGMANRTPENAARNAEGCAYVVIGAEPGRVVGVDEIDPADIETGIGPYLGPEGPQWTAQYVKPQGPGDSVLVITVEPPRRGQRMFTLRKEYSGYLEGTVFVRRPGRTIRAESADIRLLEDRYAATDRPIMLHIRPDGADDSIIVRPLANFNECYKAWGIRRRTELLPEPAVANQEPPQFVIAGDSASDSQYETEVERYLTECWKYYAEVAASRLLERGELKTKAMLVNTSDRNYTDVRIEISTSAPGAMIGAPGEFNLPSPPNVPSRNPKPTSPSPVSSSLGLPFSTITASGSSTAYTANNSFMFTPPKPPFTIRAVEGSLIITYDIDRVRPEQRISLEPFMLLYLSDAAGTLELNWQLTAGNVDGVARGTFAVTIGQPFDTAEVLPEQWPLSEH
jgi:hypothetical protein